MRNARLDDLKFQWNRTKFYIKDKIYEIPDIIGYWSGKELVLDKLEPGEYRLKYFGDSLNEKYYVIFTVENNITAIPLSVPEWATAIYVYKSNGLYVGKVRITQINSTGTEGVSKEFVENYAQPKGDYLTQADKETIIQEVIDTLGTPVFGTVDDENNIILSGNLVDGTYTLTYEKEDGSAMEIGKLILNSSDNETNDDEISGGTNNGAAYTNLANPSSADWLIDYRFNSSGATVEYGGSCVTNWITPKEGDIVRIYGLNIADSTSGYVVGEKLDGTLESTKCSLLPEGFVQDENGVWSFIYWKTSPSGTNYASNRKRMRFSGKLVVDSPDDVIITINEEIVRDIDPTNLVNLYGYTDDARWSTSEGTIRTGVTGMTAINLIPFTRAAGQTATIKLSGINWSQTTNCAVVYYIDDTRKDASQFDGSDHTYTNTGMQIVNGDNGEVTVILTDPTDSTYAGINGIKCCGYGSGAEAEVRITIT